VTFFHTNTLFNRLFLAGWSWCRQVQGHGHALTARTIQVAMQVCLDVTFPLYNCLMVTCTLRTFTRCLCAGVPRLQQYVFDTEEATPPVGPAPQPVVTPQSRCPTMLPVDEPVQWIRGDLIGAGAFGRVYAGLDEATGQLMAVKQVREFGRALPGPRDIRQDCLDIKCSS
jgi:hypothetical protein